MSIYISNAIYLSAISAGADNPNLPLIGWHSVLNIGDYTFSGTSDSPASNLWSPDTYTYWKSDDSTDATRYLEMQNGAGEQVDYIGIARHNFGTLRLAYTIQYSFDGDDWTNATTERVPSDDRAIMHYFDTQQAEYWRIRMVSSAGSPTSYAVQIAHIKLGRILKLQRPMYVGMSPYTLDKTIEAISSKSDNGNYLGQIVTAQWYNWSIQQQNNTPEFVREYVMPFINHMNLVGNVGNGPQGPFFAAWRPGDYPEEVLYAWKEASQKVAPQNQRPNGMMEWSCNGKGVV